MKIVVTGAAGVLGGLVARLLAEREDVQLRTTDALKAEAIGEFLQADLRDYAATRQIVDGCEIVIHCAAVHPWKPYTDEQYLDCNVKAVYQVAKACVECGVKKLIFTSSICAVGISEFEPEDMPVTEEAAPRTRDVYSLTKTLAEETIRMFSRKAGLNAFCLRPTNFVPRQGIEYGHALLFGGYTDPKDVAKAHVLAVDAQVSGVESIFLPPSVPYTPQDVAISRSNPAAPVERYFQGAAEWFKSRGWQLQPLCCLYSGEKAREWLSWEPEYTFARWWQTDRHQLDDLSGVQYNNINDSALIHNRDNRDDGDDGDDNDGKDDEDDKYDKRVFCR